VLSVDEKGQITVAFSTGDQDNVAPDPNQTNYVVSATETMTPVSGGRAFKAKLNWRHAFVKGEHVLGPMTLFDRELYYTTYVQPVGVGACEPGTSYLFGEHYILPSTGNILTDGGLPLWDPKAAGDPHAFTGSVVSGAAVRQRPSCAAGIASTGSTDDFLGYGQTTTVTSVTPGVFELVVQKSGQKAGGAGLGPIATGVTQVAPPRLPVRVDSWAPIIE